MVSAWAGDGEHGLPSQEELGGQRGSTHLSDGGIKACHVNPARNGVLLEGWHSRSGPLALGWTRVLWVLQPCSHANQLCKAGVWVGEELARAWEGP